MINSHYSVYNHNSNSFCPLYTYTSYFTYMETGELCIFEDKSLRQMGCITQSTIKPVALPNVHRFYKFFHQQIEWHTCNEVAHHNLNACLITIYISNCCQFSDIYISQGSVATHIRCGGIFKYEFVANLPLNLSAKELQEFSVVFNQSVSS